MKITIELNSISEFEKVISVLTALNLPSITVASPKMRKKLPTNLELGDKNIDPETLFGIWKDAPRDLNLIRSQSWNRNRLGIVEYC